MSRFQKLKLLKPEYLKQYKKMLKINLKKYFEKIPPKNEEFKNFDYYLASASTFSSNIEGNTTTFDTFLKYKTFKGLKKTKEIAEIEDLISAYEFAQKHELTFENLLYTHDALSKKICY